ncbi:MAG: glycosyltransferase [Butyricimonas faecihominis]
MFRNNSHHKDKITRSVTPKQATTDIGKTFTTKGHKKFSLKQSDIMKPVKVSVIIPVYNTELYVKQTILSIIEQTLQEIEIIIIDDGLNDNSLLFSRNYQRKIQNSIIFPYESRTIHIT